MKNTQMEHAFPCMARSPAHLSPIVRTLCSPHWGHGAPLSTFFRMSSYLSSAIEGTSQEQSHRDSLSPRCLMGHERHPCSRQGSPFFVASVACCHPRQSPLSSCHMPPVGSARGRAMDWLLPERQAAFLRSGSPGFCCWSQKFLFLGFRDMPVWFI